MHVKAVSGAIYLVVVFFLSPPCNCKFVSTPDSHNNIIIITSFCYLL